MSTEPDNSDRSEWANAGLTAFAAQTRQSKDFASGYTDAKLEVVQDFLTDLMHYCDDHDLNFNEILSDARGNYREEKAEEAEEA